VEQQYVAIDLHRRRSLIVRQNKAGEELGVVRIDNSPVALGMALAEAGPEPEVAIEATYGWYWAVDTLRAEGARVRLVNPSRLYWEDRRVKNDYKDCQELLDRMRLNRLPEAWIAPPELRQLRELVRYRTKASQLRSGLKVQVHAVLAKEGVIPPGELWGPGGARFLDEVCLGEAYGIKVESLRDLIEVYDREVTMLDRHIAHWLKDDIGYWAIQAIPGVGPVLAAIFVAEIGDVSRFSRPEQLCSWAGLTPKHRESDEIAHRGKVTKQGSRLLRWAAVEAISKMHGGPKIKTDYRRIAARRGVNIGRVAAARKLLTLVFYGLRDGEIRCLAQAEHGG
jgi:transposase